MVVLDGDGSSLMHLGSLSLVNELRDTKLEFIYVVLDNGAYETTGGQPTLMSKVDVGSVAKAMGFEECITINNCKDLESALKARGGKITMFHVKINMEYVESARVSDDRTAQQIYEDFERRIQE